MKLSLKRWMTLLACGAYACAPQATPEPVAPEVPPAAPAESGPPEAANASPSAVPAEETTLAITPSSVQLHPEYARSLARAAYIWGYPMVNMLNRRAAITKAPEPGLLNGVLPAAPQGRLAMLHGYIDPAQNFIACPNQDVAYGLGFMDLDKQPVIVQVPDFGDRFWVYAIYDIRTEQVGKLGKPYASKPGFYALVGPNYKGKVPDGVVDVIQSPTSLTNIIPRVFMDDTPEDRQAIQPLINQIMIYPFEEHTGQMKSTNWHEAPSIPVPKSGGGETKWVKPETFFDELPEVLAMTPPLPGEEALYEQFRLLVDAAKNDPKLKATLVEVAKELDATLIKDFIQWKYNGVPAGNGWNRSVHNAEWGRDYYNRTGTSKSNMFDNRPSETQYFYTDFTMGGEKLKGNSTYAVTFAKDELPPVQGFWSLTLYNEQHFFHPNALKRFSLGTKNKTLKYNADGSLTLYAGSKSPGADKESNWLPAPPGDFSLYIRAYWGKPAITEGTWKPPAIVKQ